MAPSCPRRRRQREAVPGTASTHAVNASIPVLSHPDFLPPPQGYPHSPPPSYHSGDYAWSPQPSPLYQQQNPSGQHLSSVSSPWASTADVAGLQIQPWHAPSDLPHPVGNVNFNEGAVARSMNQGAALCDRVASRLNDALGRMEVEDVQAEGDTTALMRGLSLEDGESGFQRAGHLDSDRDREAEIQARSGIIDFKKTWMYSNSRLPPQLMPLKVYIPTWSIFCRAADASAAVYHRPKSNEKQEYIQADWRQGTKAMTLNSVCLDEKNLIVFAIRGSKWNLVDWAVNFRPAPTQPVGFLDDTGNACHSGFLHVARAMIRPVAARLRQLLEQDPGRTASSLVLTGHSAGGAVASLLYMHMMSKLFESELNILTGCFRRVHCITFGAPPVSLLPLQKPNDEMKKKNIFIAFANEGDPVVRADKQYVASLCRLIASPAPANPVKTSQPVVRSKPSRQMLKRGEDQPSLSSTPAPRWPVPEATLSNAGRVVLLRKKPAPKHGSEAVCVSDQELRRVVFGDPSMHDMTLYKRRIDELAIAAVTGRND